MGEKRCFLRFPAPITTYKISIFYLKMVDLGVVIGTEIHRFLHHYATSESGTLPLEFEDNKESPSRDASLWTP